MRSQSQRSADAITSLILGLLGLSIVIWELGWLAGFGLFLAMWSCVLQASFIAEEELEGAVRGMTTAFNEAFGQLFKGKPDA